MKLAIKRPKKQAKIVFPSRKKKRGIYTVKVCEKNQSKKTSSGSINIPIRPQSLNFSKHFTHMHVSK